MERSKEDLQSLIELIESGKVTPVIDRTHPLSEVPEAIRYLEEGHARGKVVITENQSWVELLPRLGRPTERLVPCSTASMAAR